jgi:hypothetical protein
MHELASVFGLPAEDWSALAAWTTVAVAVGAALAAFRQVAEARRLRAEQAQPYVVVYLEEAGVRHFIDLVIANLGTTAATEIVVSMQPEPERALGAGPGEWSPLVPDEIPVLVPGQQWRTLFDATHVRGESALPRRYAVTARFKDSRMKQSFSFDYVLDWDVIFNRGSATVHGVHDLAKSVDEIKQAITTWREGPGTQGLAVHVRDGDARDARLQERYRTRGADDDEERSGLLARLLPRIARRKP